MGKRNQAQVSAIVVSVLLLVVACSNSTRSEGAETSPVSAPAAESPVTEAIDFEGISASVSDCTYGGLIRAIESLDEMTVAFSLCRPDVAFLSKVAHPAFGILPSDYLESTGGGLALVETPIGTGPFVLDRWESGVQIMLAANPNYWGEQSSVENVVIRWNSDATERLAELRSGAVDAVEELSGSDFASVSADPELQLLQHRALSTMYIGMNRDRGPLSDQKVRQAIGRAIDRDLLVDSYFPQGTVVAEQLLPRSIFGYAAQVANYEYNPEVAREAITEAGYEDGFEIVLSYSELPTEYLPDPIGVAESIKFQLAAIGITVTLEPQDANVLLQRADLGELDLFLLGLTPDPPNLTTSLEDTFGTTSAFQFGEHIPELEAVLTQAGLTSDLTLRRNYLGEAAALIKEQAPMIPIAHAASAAAWSSAVDGANSSPLATETFAAVSVESGDTFVWMQATEPAGLYCADEHNADSTRICAQVVESLLSYQVGGLGVRPSLATGWKSNGTFTEWTFRLRPGVSFHDGSTLDANDVVLSYLVQWDKSHPLHVGRHGEFSYFSALFGSLADATS